MTRKDLIQTILNRRKRLRIWSGLMLATVLLLILADMQGWLPAAGEGSVELTAGVLIAIFLGAILCEYVDSALGMGYGTTLTPVLLLAGFEPLQIVPCVLVSEFITGITAAALHHRDGNVDFLRDAQARSAAFWLSLLSVVGAIVAVSVALSIPKYWLKLIIAIIIVSIGVVILLSIKRQFRYRRGHMIVLGAVAAFNKALSGGGYGPLVTAGQVVSGLPAKSAVAITSAAEGLTCAVGLIAYLVMRNHLDFALAIPLTAGALLSVPLATLTVRRIPEKYMRASVGVLTCTLGLLALGKVLL